MAEWLSHTHPLSGQSSQCTFCSKQTMYCSMWVYWASLTGHAVETLVPWPVQTRKVSRDYSVRGSLKKLAFPYPGSRKHPCPVVLPATVISMNHGTPTKLGLTWTQNQSGSGMLTSVDPSSPLSSRSQLCRHQPLPHQISSQAEIPKTRAGCENGPGFEWSTPKQRARLGSGKQGKLVT